jgi:hypothetical protein
MDHGQRTASAKMEFFARKKRICSSSKFLTQSSMDLRQRTLCKCKIGIFSKKKKDMQQQQILTLSGMDQEKRTLCKC